MLLPETTKRMEHAAQVAPDFVPNADVQDEQHSKSLVELIGPAGVGKSTIMELVTKFDPDFSFVTGFTTRFEEERDVPGRYTYFNSDNEINSLIDRIEKGNVVQYIGHPTTHQLYGSFPEDYHSKYNLLDVLSNSVDSLDKLAFESIFKIAVVSHGQQWARRFMERYPEISDERTKRILEAEMSIAWMLEQHQGEIIWLENPVGGVVAASNELIDIVKNGKPSRDLRFLAEEMLDEASKIRQ